MEKIVKEIVAKLSSTPNPDKSDKLIDDLGFDSLKMLELIGALEQQLNIALDDDDLDMAHFESIETINQLMSKYCENR